MIDLIVKSPSLGVTIPKDKTNLSIHSSAFTLEQQKLIIQYLNLSRAKNEILLALYAGMNINVVSKLLGHSKIKLTLDIYSHVLEQFQYEEISKITNYFKGKELFRTDCHP